MSTHRPSLTHGHLPTGEQNLVYDAFKAVEKLVNMLNTAFVLFVLLIVDFRICRFNLPGAESTTLTSNMSATLFKLCETQLMYGVMAGRLLFSLLRSCLHSCINILSAIVVEMGTGYLELCSRLIWLVKLSLAAWWHDSLNATLKQWVTISLLVSLDCASQIWVAFVLI